MCVNSKSIYGQKPKFACNQSLIICSVSYQMPPIVQYSFCKLPGGLKLIKNELNINFKRLLDI